MTKKKLMTDRRKKQENGMIGKMHMKKEPVIGGIDEINDWSSYLCIYDCINKLHSYTNT